MIKSFKDKRAKLLYEGISIKEWASFRTQAEKRLLILEQATSLNDLMNLPSNHFKALTGNRKGQFSIRINMQWRVCFKWIDNEPCDVEIVDYH